MKQEFKDRIIAALKEQSPNYRSQSKMAVALEVNSAQLSRLLHNDTDRVLSDSKYRLLARKLNVPENPYNSWNIAKTEAFEYLYEQLKGCKKHSISSIFCDSADIGKTATAKQFCRENRNAIYIDCSQVKSRQKLIKQIAKEFGITHEGRYQTIYQDLTQYIRSMTQPIVILDEAGDLEYPAFLELKALWNATEFSCGWYMMGADGLRDKINRSKNLNKVGFAEIFRRYGSRYQRVTPEGPEALQDFLRTQMIQVAKANGCQMNMKDLWKKTAGSLTRVYIEIQKEKSKYAEAS